MNSTVYFSRTITPEKVLELYQLLEKTLKGNMAVKVHSGEKGNQNFLKKVISLHSALQTSVSIASKHKITLQGL